MGSFFPFISVSIYFIFVYGLLLDTCNLGLLCPLLEKEMAPHSGTLAWRIPWMEEPGGLQSMGLQRVRQGQVTNTALQLLCEAVRILRRLTLSRKSEKAFLGEED